MEGKNGISEFFLGGLTYRIDLADRDLEPGSNVLCCLRSSLR